MESNADRIQDSNYECFEGNNCNYKMKSYGTHDNSFNLNYDSDTTWKSSNNRRRLNSFNATNLQRLVQDLSVEEAQALDLNIINKPSNNIEKDAVILLHESKPSQQLKQHQPQPQARASSAPRFRICINDSFSIQEAMASPPDAKNCQKPMRYQSPSKSIQQNNSEEGQIVTSLLSASDDASSNLNLSSVPEQARKRITKTSTKSRIRRKSLDTLDSISLREVSDISMGSSRTASQKRRGSGNKKKLVCVPASLVNEIFGGSTSVNYNKLTKAIQKSNHAMLNRASIIIANEGWNGNTLISDRCSERSTSCPRVRFNEDSLIHRSSDITLGRSKQDSNDKLVLPGTNASDNDNIRTSFRNDSPDNRSVTDVDLFINELTTTNSSRPKSIIKLTKKSYRSNSSDSINPNSVKDVARVRRSLVSAMKKSNKNCNAIYGESGISDGEDSDYDTSYQVPLTTLLSLTRSTSTSAYRQNDITSNNVGGSDAMQTTNQTSSVIFTSTSDTAPRIVRRKPSM